MCTLFPPLCPPFWPPLYTVLELRARLTPFWKARRQTDEIIERDRRFVRKYRRDSRDSSGSPDGKQPVGLTVMLHSEFYYVWFGHSLGAPPNIIVTCLPLMVACPDFVVQKSKLRRDQIEYLERRRLRDYD